MKNKYQPKYVERMKAKGMVYFQKWLPKDLYKQIIELIENYKD